MKKLVIVMVLLMFLSCKKEQSLKVETKDEVVQTHYHSTTKNCPN